MVNTDPLKPAEIECLALEGGGGKGFAYLGALEVLEKLQVMPAIKAVSGTSAGAITALMVAVGMTSKEIRTELRTTDFDTFFDAPLDRHGRRLVPAPFEYETRRDDKCEELVTAGRFRSLLDVVQCLNGRPSTLAQVTGTLAYVYSLEGDVGLYARRMLARVLGARKGPLAILLEHLPLYLAFLHRDMGLFSGIAARTYLDGLIRRMAEEITHDPVFRTGPSVPFRLFDAVFGRKLLVCGANLSSGKTVLFSAKHTPNFPVADAVRISMGLPLIYKPYRITQRVPGWPPCGSYVDGGIYNNLPFREVGALVHARTTSSTPSRSAAVAPTPVAAEAGAVHTVAGERSTLGLRLEVEPPEVVDTAGSLLRKILTLGLSAGESNVIADIEPFALTLDTTDLSLLEFSPPERVQEKVSRRSRRAMYRYFGLEPPLIDRDDQEDARIARARSRDACG